MISNRVRVFVFSLLVCCLLLVPSLYVHAVGLEDPKVSTIVVSGNDRIDTRLIESAISKTQLGSPVVEQDILDDMDAIYSLGYFYDVTASFELEPSGGVRIIFSVYENPVIKDIVFKGSTIAPVQAFRREMQIRPGQVLNVNQLLEDVQFLPDWMLLEHGVAIRPTDVRADDDGVIEITIAETTLKEILIEGNEKTQEFVIRRELTVKPGDVLDMDEVNRSLRRILMLGFFDEISRSFADGDHPDETIMTIHVTERKTGSATFGAGYSSVDSVFGFVDVAEENFLGRAQRINAYLEIGRGRRVVELGFFEPYIDDKGTSLGVNVYRRRSELTAWVQEEPISGDRIIIGGDITLGRPLGEYTRGRLTLKAQNISYGEELSAYERFSAYKSRIVGVGANTNTTDHPFFPTEGFKNDVYFEMGTRLFDGDAVFSKVEVEHSRFFELYDGGYVFAVRGSGGRLLGGELRENELFRLGGSESLRGYGYGDPDLVGDKTLLMNAEFRFPIFERVYGVVFSDWGRAWKDDESINLTELLNSYGLGLRLDTPIGLLRLDYGRGKDYDTGERQGQFYFGIGQTF